MFDEVDEAVECLVSGDVVFDTGFADIEVDFVGGSSDVAEVCVGHFSRAVDDTTHDGDGDAFEVVGFGTDALGDALEVKEGASTTGAGDKFGFGDPCSCSLKDVVGKGYGLFEIGLVFNGDEVANAVTEKVARKDTAFEKAIGEVVFWGDAVCMGVAYPDGCLGKMFFGHLDEGSVLSCWVNEWGGLIWVNLGGENEIFSAHF